VRLSSNWIYKRIKRKNNGSKNYSTINGSKGSQEEMIAHIMEYLGTPVSTMNQQQPVMTNTIIIATTIIKMKIKIIR
jgi:hypothetical protein